MIAARLRDIVSGLSAVAGGLALLAHGGRFSAALDLLTHFAPIYLVVGTAAAALELAGPRRRLPLAAALAAVIASGALMAPEALVRRGDRAVAAGPTLKLIQFNVWRRNSGCRAVAEWLATERPDVVLIQEASPAVRDCILARTGWNIVGRRTSVMIFSPHPLTGIGVRPQLPPEPAPTWVNARMYGAWGETPILAVHYTWPTSDPGRRQGAYMSRIVEAIGRERLLFGGDFNSTPWSFTRRGEDKDFGLQRVTRALFSWPSYLGPGVLPIDHVYIGPAWRALSVRKGPSLGSDHFPVVVELAPVRPAVS